MRYILQERRATGEWRELGRWKLERTALARCADFGNATPGGTFRVILGDPNGAFQVIGMRAPSVPQDSRLAR